MEKPHKIIFSFVALLLYWLSASGFSYDSGRRTQVDKDLVSTGSHIYLAEEFPFDSGFAVKEGAGFWSAGNSSSWSYKQPQFFKAIVRALEVQVACAFLQNISQFNNNPVLIRKSDMLFPFHYFFEPARA